VEIIYFIVLILLICIFEFLTSNTVVNLVYSNTLTPVQSAFYFGFFNFIGIVTAGITVAVSLSMLVPIEVFLGASSSHNFYFVFCVAISSLFLYWLLTQFGIPTSSTHALTGSVIGASLSYSFAKGTYANIDWAFIIQISVGLLAAPLLSFLFAIPLLLMLRRIIKSKGFFKTPKKTNPPPLFPRSLILISNAALSFSNGSNNGQKGLGIIILALIAIFPAQYAVDNNIKKEYIALQINIVQEVISKIDREETAKYKVETLEKMDESLTNIKLLLKSSSLGDYDALVLKSEIQNLVKNTKKMMKEGSFDFKREDRMRLKKRLKKALNNLKNYVNFIPFYLILLIAVVLTMGALYSYKRILKTWKNKIGANSPDYSQLAVSDMSAALSIGIASLFSVPASTSHALTGGLTGSMAAKSGFTSVKWNFLATLILAWFFTLPLCAILSFGLYQLYYLVK